MVTMKKNICPTCGGTKDDRQLMIELPSEKTFKCFDKFHFNKGDIFRCRRLKCKNTVTGKATICDSCINKDKAKKRKIKRNQRAIGIKATRKKKVIWKDKADSHNYNRDPVQYFYLKRVGKAIYTKIDAEKRWSKTSLQKLTFLERNYMCRGNPEVK